MSRAIWQNSGFRSAWRGSYLLGWWQAAPPQREVFPNAALLRVLRAKYVRLACVAACVAVGVITASVSASWAVLLLTAIAIASFFQPIWALAVLPAACIWAPRIVLFTLGKESVFLRVDHALVTGIILHLATERRHRFRDTPILTPFLIFLALAAASSTIGLLTRTVSMPEATVLYVAHTAHLVLILAVAYGLGGELGAIGLYAWALPVIAAAVYGLIGWIWPFCDDPGVVYRCFERVVFDGQANHFAGLFAVGACLGLALLREARWRALGFGLAALSMAALPTTRSEPGLVAWIAGMAALGMLWIPRLRYTLPPIGILGLFLAPQAWWHRLTAPGTSMHDRLTAWKSALSTLPTHPLLGLGTGARHRSFYDSQYFMTLSENGVLGLAAWLFAIASLARALLLRRNRPEWAGAVCTGALAGLAATCVHALAASSFIVTVLAGPLFWLCGFALANGERES